MKFQDIYASVGLVENPFGVHALSPDERGERLMVGRDHDVEMVAQRLHKQGKITCLDGHVGVGKTSLVNVAAYKCFKAYLAGETSQLLIPSVTSFQLKKDGNVDEFCQEVFQGVGQTLLRFAAQVQQLDLSTGQPLPHVSAWLDSSAMQYLKGGADRNAVLGASDATATSTVNPGAAGVPMALAHGSYEMPVRQWLDEIFTSSGSGGVVCVIDNIELLETGPAARRMLEALRDKLFTVNGLRWVFCGANGVIHSLASSPRLTAFLSTPLDVDNIHPSALSEVIKARLAEFSTDAAKAEAELPIEIEDLKDLYILVNCNLRDLLGLADEFCEYCSVARQRLTSRDKRTKFEKWLHKVTVDKYNALQSRISEKAWAVLDIAMSVQFNGTFGVGDYNSFNNNSSVSFEKNTFTRWIRDLVKLGLLSKSIDDGQAEDDGFNRDVFSVTASGALVHYARRQKRENYSLAQPVEWMRRVHN